ncbi:hypothetical protein FCV25MIE_14874, partial [Fagus crenata]
MEAEAPGFTVEDDAMGDSKQLGSHCLLVKLLTDRLFNKKAMKYDVANLGVDAG